jgi:hypothetical protein
MYLGVNFAMNAEGTSGLNEEYYFYFGGDLIQTFMGENAYSNLNTITNNTKGNWTSYNIDIDSATMDLPQQEAGEVTGEGGVSFIDALKVLWAIVPTMGNIVISPLTLFFNFDMPVFIGLMIGLPYIFVLAISFYALLGGRE